MCILQRYAFVAIGLSRWPQRSTTRVNRKVGLQRTAGDFRRSRRRCRRRHVWLEHNRPGLRLRRRPRLHDESLPLADALPMIFRGTGDCTKVLWRFLGLSIAEWR